MNDVKRGLATSELWAGTVTPGAMITTLVSTAKAETAWATAFACVAIAILGAAYTWSRAQVKSA